MMHRGRARALLYDCRGAVFFEFLLVILPLWVLFLSLTQLALFAHANLLVKHAAESAARSAAVVLPDDPREYGGEPVMSVERGRVSAQGLVSVLGSLFSVGPSEAPAASARSNRTLLNLGRSRLNTIRLAAHVPMMPLAPVDVGFDRQPTIRKALPGRRSLLKALVYQPLALAVTFPELDGDRVEGPELTVRVTYALQCKTPVVRRFLCRRLDDLIEKGDLDRAFLPLAQSFVGGRFKKISHQTTVMIQDAPYAFEARES